MAIIYLAGFFLNLNTVAVLLQENAEMNSVIKMNGKCNQQNMNEQMIKIHWRK